MGLSGKMKLSYYFLSFYYMKIWNEEYLSREGEQEKIREAYLPEFKRIIGAAEVAGLEVVKKIAIKHCEKDLHYHME